MMTNMSEPLSDINGMFPSLTVSHEGGVVLANKMGCGVRWYNSAHAVVYSRVLKRHKWHLGPALQFARYDRMQRGDAARTVVQARHDGELFSTITFEAVRAFDRDFLERLQAIGGKSRHHDGNALDALAAESFERLVGVGTQPGG